jgi:tRNA A58 N-methylase Trm61
LRLQKTGSGENAALLYHVNPNGQVWRLEQHLDDLAFAVATSASHLSRNDYYHIAVGLVAWDIKSELLRLKITASPEDKANPAINRAVVYDLRKNRMAPD